MEFNWTTFVLEIINFLVLVWILKKFLYRPVLAALQQRQDRIDQKLDEASRLKAEGTALEQQYQSRMTDWDHEKQQVDDALHPRNSVSADKKSWRNWNRNLPAKEKKQPLTSNVTKLKHNSNTSTMHINREPNCRQSTKQPRRTRT